MLSIIPVVPSTGTVQNVGSRFNVTFLHRSIVCITTNSKYHMHTFNCTNVGSPLLIFLIGLNFCSGCSETEHVAKLCAPRNKSTKILNWEIKLELLSSWGKTVSAKTLKAACYSLGESLIRYKDCSGGTDASPSCRISFQPLPPNKKKVGRYEILLISLGFR